MKEIFLFILVCYGISNIVVFGSIFNNLRQYCIRISPHFLGQLTSCMICFPTWCGFILSGVSHIFNFGLSPFQMIGVCWWPLAVFLDGCLASGGVWLIHTLQEYLESLTYDKSKE